MRQLKLELTIKLFDDGTISAATTNCGTSPPIVTALALGTLELLKASIISRGASFPANLPEDTGELA